jgi:hypothetical protein
VIGRISGKIVSGLSKVLASAMVRRRAVTIRCSPGGNPD